MDHGVFAAFSFLIIAFWQWLRYEERVTTLGETLGLIFSILAWSLCYFLWGMNV